jgi:hypothetical protein
VLFAPNAARGHAAGEGQRDDRQRLAHPRGGFSEPARRNAGGPGAGGPAAARRSGRHQLVNFANIGGNGVGPGGGFGAVDPLAIATGGTFVGVPELRPLLGGSGGGGRSNDGTSGAAAGVAGGGSGPVLIVANGTIDIQSGATSTPTAAPAALSL